MLIYTSVIKDIATKKVCKADQMKEGLDECVFLKPIQGGFQSYAPLFKGYIPNHPFFSERTMHRNNYFSLSAD